MVALCVDDEELLLNELVRAVKASPAITDIASFKTYSDAVAWAGDNRPDVAFLDIQLRGHTGFELAEKLWELWGDLPIIFCTGYREYAVDAFRIHVSGYLIKPVDAVSVQKEIDRIRKPVEKDRLTVNCFGNFDVLKEGKPLSFKRKRSKEVLAYLVDRKGASVTAKEICAVLWEDEGDTEKNLMHLYKLTADLRTTLESVGEGEVFVKDGYNYYIDAAKIECDYYRYLAGDPLARKKFQGEYMLQYSWAEETAARLDMNSLY